MCWIGRRLLMFIMLKSGLCVREKGNVFVLLMRHLVLYRPPLCTFAKVFRSSLLSNTLHHSISWCNKLTPDLCLFAATDACLCQKPGNVCVTTCQKQASLTGTCTERFLHRCNKTNERDHQKLSSLVGRQQNEDKAWFFPYVFLTLSTKT